MPFQNWVGLLESGYTASAAAVSGTTAETILVPDFPCNANIPGVGPMQPGTTYRMKVRGTMTTASSSPGTVTFRVRWGGVSGTSLAASAGISLNTSQSTATFELEYTLVVQTVSSTTGSILVVGRVDLGANAATNVVNFLPATGAATTSSLNNLSQENLSTTIQFSSSTTNAAQAVQYILESLN
jgi:hypothetical protein